MSKLSRFATWGLVGLIAVNIAGAAGYVVLQKQLHKAPPQPALAIGNKFPEVSGMDVRGVKWKSQDAPCRAIRITDDRCTYCKKDKPSYEEFIAAARQSSCEIVEIAPQAGGMAYDPRPGVVQLKYINGDIGSMLFPFVTPQTVILDRNWTLRWNKRGIFDEKSLASSVTLMRSLAAN